MTENSMQNNRKNRDPETRSGHGLPFGDPRDGFLCLPAEEGL